jgi:hypothetical protein
MAAALKEAAKIFAMDQRGPPAVDRGQALLHPVAHGVSMDPQCARGFLHRVISVDLHEPRI